MAVLVPNLMNIPFCDFGVGAIGGSMRSLTTYVVSRYVLIIIHSVLYYSTAVHEMMCGVFVLLVSYI